MRESKTEKRQSDRGRATSSDAGVGPGKATQVDRAMNSAAPDASTAIGAASAGTGRPQALGAPPGRAMSAVSPGGDATSLRSGQTVSAEPYVLGQDFQVPKLALGSDATSRNASARDAMQTLAAGFDHSFDGVTIHADAAGEARAKSHGKKAVAEGSSIYLGRDVDPASSDGRKIIGHEMAHVVQQNAAPPAGDKAPQQHPGDADLEHEAHRIGSIVAAGGRAMPQLRTNGARAQGFDSPEHQSMGTDVHSILDPVAQGSGQLGGVSQSELEEQRQNEAKAGGVSHAPGVGRGVVADVDANARAGVPQLAAMLKRDPFMDRDRSLTLSVRNFKVQQDQAGPYLAIDIDPKTKEVIRYDVPVSPGDLTAMNGDLYGSMENMRKAPAKEILALQALLDQEAQWEHDIAAGKADPKSEPNFDTKYEAATSWRRQPVYAAGANLGPEGAGTGGDGMSYADLALHNQAHFGEDTQAKQQLEIHVRTDGLEALAQGPQGNLADGNEQAWLDGHAKALLLAREAFALKNEQGSTTTAELQAEQDHYGHETALPSTGLVDPTVGSRTLDPLPKDANGQALKRSSNVITHESKLNDAYVENAGADHYLTDAFAAGHQIVREAAGRVIDQFVKDKGGRSPFLKFITHKLQEGAAHDKERADGDLGKFQKYSHGGWTSKLARGESWFNVWPLKYTPLIGGPGMEQKLDQKMDEVTLRALGAKLIHDYYNRHGMIVHNQKGMTFEIKGDGHAAEAPEARQIIAMAVLASRDQITQAAKQGVAANPLDVWAYTPDLDKTALTETSGRKILDLLMSDGDYMWGMLKEYFGMDVTPPKSNAQEVSAGDPVQGAIMASATAGQGSRATVDMGQAPMKTWFDIRQQYVQSIADSHAAPEKQEYGAPPTTVDGVTLPGQDE